MRKYLISTVAIFVVLALVWSVSGQPAGGGARGGGMGGMDFGGVGGRGGMRRGLRVRERPDRAARLEAVKELEKQIATLKAAIEKAPATDPNIANLEGDALTKFMDVYTPESNAINAIQQTLSALRGGGRGGRGGGASEDVLSEIRVLAQKEKATKTVARLDALIKEAQNRASRRGAGGFGGAPGGGQRRGQQ
jgi:hypothetical protein